MATTTERSNKPQIKSTSPVFSPGFIILHIGGLVVFGLAILVLTVVNFLPLWQGMKTAQPETIPVTIPSYDYSKWNALSVLHGGRYKPLQTASQEVMRQIAGRNSMHGKDSLAVVLMWMLENDPKAINPKSQWDNVPFLLCEHKKVRELLYRLDPNGILTDKELTHEQQHGKYLSPSDARLLRENLKELEGRNPPRFRELTSPIEKPLEDLLGKLRFYEGLRLPPAVNADRSSDPFGFVALDKVQDSPWFTIGQLRLLDRDPADQWYKQMKDRVKNAPQLYIKPDHQNALLAFQKEVQAGRGLAAIDDLQKDLGLLRDQSVQKYLKLRPAGKSEEAFTHLASALLTWPVEDSKSLSDPQSESQIRRRFHIDAILKKDASSDEVTKAFTLFLSERDQRQLEDLKKRLPKGGSYNAEDQKFRMLHLSYLETRFPELYEQAKTWQEAPIQKIKSVLTSFDSLGIAYRSGDPEKFANSSQDYFQTLEKVSSEVTTYPGTDSPSDRLGGLFTGRQPHHPSAQLIDLELTFNRIRPFMWGWIFMLGSLSLLVLGMGFRAYWLYNFGLAIYFISLAFQLFGFVTRIVIAGRPPVTNMYETVIWVAFMSGIFALILEFIFKRKVIALAGAFVTTITLVLADTMPLALDPRINPIVPVLRSNFWLTIHVLTIVSSYAGGTLAWGLGNISLILILFGKANQDTIKLLSNFTYRAIQIAVLLLATGTFLGGWWAAYSWGRFWGWDSKEVGALIALVCYVIPLHMRFIGWIKDFGLAVSAILCYISILGAWYGVNFLWPAGLHAYGGEGDSTAAYWVFWASALNIEWMLVASLMFRWKSSQGEKIPELA